MSLSERIASFLESDAVGQIHFRASGTAVYGSGYGIIARAIRNRHIQCQENVRFDRAMACYRHSVGPNQVNVLDVSTDAAPVEGVEACGLIVHECTHALQDYHRRSLTVIDAECAAYIAQAMYWHIATRGVFPGQAGSQHVGLSVVAWNIAHRILTTPQAYDATPEEIQTLKTQILTIDVYKTRQDDIQAFDGLIRGQSMRP